VTRLLRAGVVGLGRMGRHHVRVLGQMDDVELVGVVDPSQEARRAVAGTELLTTVRELVDRRIDLCVVASPTVTHSEIGLQLAEAGVATLIEKPLAHDSKAAQTIVETFERNGVLGCVGHIERFNPALQAMRRRLDAGELGSIYQVVTRRQGPFPDRVVDSGVVMDLATHDIDLTAWVTRSSYRSISARTAHRSGRPHEDLVSVVAELSSGIIVTHLVNWLSPMKERVTVVTGERGCFVADTVTADLTYYENGTEPVEWDRMASFRGVSEGDMTRYAIPKREPLLNELTHFVAAARGEPSDAVTLREGLTTVRVAEIVRESASSGQTVQVQA